MRCACAGSAPRQDLASVGDVLPELHHILVIYALDLVDAKAADLSSYPFEFTRFARWH